MTSLKPGPAAGLGSKPDTEGLETKMASMEIKKAEQVTKTYDNGQKYVGEFKDGNFHGQGTKYRRDGSVEYKGQWLNDQPVGR